MAKAVLVTYLFALAIGSTSAFAKECAVGPEYWCQSLENARDCGSIQHCVDTVWSHDEKYEKVESSTTCQWCQKILAKTHEGLGDSEDAVASTLTNACNLLPTEDLQTKCTNTVTNHGTAVLSLLKKQRFGTLCRLMNVCSKDQSVHIVGKSRCTWGPSYWCSSLSNSRECQATDHCAKQVWSQQAMVKKENDNVCQYCEYIVDKLRSYLTDGKVETNVEHWLTGACDMLQNQDIVEKCKQTMSGYADEIFLLVKNNINSGVICHLGEMCKDGTITPREKLSGEQSKILCDVIVQATHELSINQKKSANEVQRFLKKDCQQLETSELKEKCEELVEQYGNQIYQRVGEHVELSKICDLTIFQPDPHLQCDLCSFVIASAKAMLDNKQSNDKVTEYIDQQLCQRLNGAMRSNCQSAIKTDGEILMNQIQQGKQPMLICTYFQACFKEIQQSNEIPREEVRSFYTETFCGRLGRFQEPCRTLIETDSTGLYKSLIGELDGDVLCQIFGICPTKMSLLDNLSVRDDTNKCKRCVDDFSRRKHIAEKLLNHSSEFLHHLCGQLPDKDQCIQAVEEPINKLVTFIQSLDPKVICEELKYCNETSLATLQDTSTDMAFTSQAIDYIDHEICPKSGPLSQWCHTVIVSEGRSLLGMISQHMDPHQVCSIIDICPKTTAFDNCNDKCACCVSKVENYQAQLAAFLNTMVSTAEDLCTRMSHSSECQQMANGLKMTVNEIITNFNAKQICERLTHCSKSDQCQSCQTNLNARQGNFRAILTAISSTLQTFCSDQSCRSKIQSTYQAFADQLDELHSSTLCQRLGYCALGHSQQAIPLLAVSEISDTLCDRFGPLKEICKELFASKENAFLSKVYQALLNNDRTIIDEDLREQTSSTCDLCKNYVQTAKTQWLNGLESVRNALLQTCSICPSKDQCQAYLNQRFDNLTAYVKQIDPQAFCQSIHLCSTATCSACSARLNLRREALLQGIDRLAGYFTDLCQKYSSKECQIYVKEMKDSIQQSISAFDSQELCTSVGFCGSQSSMSFGEYERSVEEDLEQNICSLLGPFQGLCPDILHGNVDGIQQSKMSFTLEDLMSLGEEFDQSKDKCKCCIARVEERKRRSKFIGDAIYDSLIRSCRRCPAEQQCRRFYRREKAKFDARIRHICPYLVCVRFGYCNKTNATEMKPVDRSNSTCILCEYVMNYLSSYIRSNSTEEEIEESLEQVCDRVPTVLQNQCREYVEDYTPTIISILMNDFNLSTVCQKLNLCTRQMKVELKHLTQADASTCGVCDYVSTYLHFESQRNADGQSLQRALTTVCQHLSSEYHSKCRSLIQLFSPDVSELELAPTKNFCKQLPICQAPMTILQPAQPLIEPANALPKCTVCEFIISYLDAALRNNKSEQAIEEALKKVCTILPSAEREQCNQLVKTYGSVIAELIAEAVDPATVCRRLGLCPQQQPQSSTATYGKCIFGVKYWCENRRNAELCHAVDLCERQVWSKKKPLIY